MNSINNRRLAYEVSLDGRGVPCFYKGKRLPRIITNDIWSYLMHHSEKRFKGDKLKKAMSFIQQAFDFYIAAANPRQSSRPLLYYYAYLNLAKLYLLNCNIDLPAKMYHGINDPKINNKSRLHFRSQVISIENIKSDHSKIFPEILMNCPREVDYNLPRTIKVLDLISQIPTIHRTYVNITGNKPLFCPIGILRVYKERDRLWMRIGLEKKDADVRDTIKTINKRRGFKSLFGIIEKNDNIGDGYRFEDYYIFESKPMSYEPYRIDSALDVLSQKFRKLGVWTIFTNRGYRYYLSGHEPRLTLPQMCSSYAIMFYLGSITRYKPYDYDKIIARYQWLINDFIETHPPQFLYILASTLAGTEVVNPPIPSLRFAK